MENLFLENNLLYYDVKFSKIDNFAINMVQKATTLDSLVPIYYSQNKNKIYFEMEDYTPLSSIMENTLDTTMVLNIFTQICETINYVKIHMLDENNLVLDSQYVYFDVNTNSIKMVYVPIEEAEDKANFRNFFKELIFDLNTDDLQLSSTLYKQINKKPFDLAGLFDFLKLKQQHLNSRATKEIHPLSETHKEVITLNNVNTVATPIVNTIQETPIEETTIDELLSKLDDEDIEDIEETPKAVNIEVEEPKEKETEEVEEISLESLEQFIEEETKSDEDESEESKPEEPSVEETPKPVESIAIEPLPDVAESPKVSPVEPLKEEEPKTPPVEVEVHENVVEESPSIEESFKPVEESPSISGAFNEDDDDDTPFTLEEILKSNSFSPSDEEESFKPPIAEDTNLDDSQNMLDIQELLQDSISIPEEMQETANGNYSESKSEPFSLYDDDDERKSDLEKFLSYDNEQRQNNFNFNFNDDETSNGESTPLQSAPDDDTPNNRVIAKLVRTKDNTAMVINKKYFIIGKGNNTDFTITDNSTISRSHATIIDENGIYYISDNGSSNGTWLNNNKIKQLEKVRLKNKDIITLASNKETFIFYLE